MGPLPGGHMGPGICRNAVGRGLRTVSPGGLSFDKHIGLPNAGRSALAGEALQGDSR